MTFSLAGRLQTRIVLYAVIGALWTLLVTPVLPTRLPLGASYGMAFTVLLVTVVLGLVWELAYHLLQQFRWDKDWPIAFLLLSGIPESLLVWVLLTTDTWFWDVPVTAAGFWALFVSTWLVAWVLLVGPIRILLAGRRWHGGRLIG